MAAAKRSPRRPLPMRGEKVDVVRAIAEMHEMEGAILSALEDGEDYFSVLKKGCPLFKRLSNDCTGEHSVPDSQAAQDAMIGGAVRWTFGKAWGAIPHLWRVVIVAGGGATAYGVGWPGVKAALSGLINSL